MLSVFIKEKTSENKKQKTCESKGTSGVKVSGRQSVFLQCFNTSLIKVLEKVLKTKFQAKT